MKLVTIENKLIRILLAAVFCCPLAIVVANLISEIFLYAYMFFNDISARSDLSEDYGFGMLGFMIFILSLIISAIIFFVGIYKLTGDDD